MPYQAKNFKLNTLLYTASIYRLLLYMRVLPSQAINTSDIDLSLVVPNECINRLFLASLAIYTSDISLWLVIIASETSD